MSLLEPAESWDQTCARLGIDPDAMAGRNTHRTVARLADPPRTGWVLDLGAGQGAFTAWLRDRGYQVAALGIAAGQFSLDAPYVLTDLDAGLPARSDALDGVIAIEIMEHLESPLRVVRDVARCLRPGGWLVLTTPNVSSLASKVSFALRGYPIYFGPTEYAENGHISPISLLDVRRIADRVGLTVEAVTYNVGKLPVPRLRHRWVLDSPRWLAAAWGESLIVKLRKTGTPRRDVTRG